MDATKECSVSTTNQTRAPFLRLHASCFCPKVNVAAMSAHLALRRPLQPDESVTCLHMQCWHWEGPKFHCNALAKSTHTKTIVMRYTDKPKHK